MAASLLYKIYNADNEYVAACKFAVDAAAVVSNWGVGATIRYGHSKKCILWTEGKETEYAGNSYDFVSATCIRRLCIRRLKAVYGKKD